MAHDIAYYETDLHFAYKIPLDVTNTADIEISCLKYIFSRFTLVNHKLKYWFSCFLYERLSGKFWNFRLCWLQLERRRTNRTTKMTFYGRCCKYLNFVKISNWVRSPFNKTIQPHQALNIKQLWNICLTFSWHIYIRVLKFSLLVHSVFKFC